MIEVPLLDDGAQPGRWVLQMLRNKLSFILASSLSLAFVGCDDGDGDDTGAGTDSGTTDATTTDTPTTDTPTTDTPTTDTPTTDTPTTDGETTDTPDTDTSDDSSTTDDTSADPCEGVTCDDGQSCVGGICVDDSETDTGGGDPDANYPNPADGCPKGTVDASANGIALCVPECDGAAADIASACVDPETGTSPGVCLLYPPGGSGAECTMEEFGTSAACEADGEFCTSIAAGAFTCETAGFCAISCTPDSTCPDAMTCSAMGVCQYE